VPTSGRRVLRSERVIGRPQLRSKQVLLGQPRSMVRPRARATRRAEVPADADGCARPMIPGTETSLSRMSFQSLLAQSIVSDADVAERWYTMLFDGPPDARPMDGLVEWQLGGSFGVQVWRDPQRAGRSVMVLHESDLDVLATRLTAAGINHDGPQDVTASRLLALADPDGNQVIVTGV
jgi:hypothetical protein